jgi:DMSO/TMAO reductase YedYZ heme-binding membrane subunit
LGIVSFWLLTITVLAAEFKKANPWMRANWRKLHVLNYLVFLIVGLHGFLIGTDFKIQPFYSFAIVAYLSVLYTVVRKLPLLLSTYKNWLKG